MKRFLTVLPVIILLAASLVAIAATDDASPSGRSTPEIEYLKAVNERRPPSDPQLLFILMQQFANASRQREGIAFFEAALARFGPTLTDSQRAQYLVAIASLRAGEAGHVFVVRRIGWVRDTVKMLDEAKRLTHGEMFIARWMSGIVRARLPHFFGERETALEDLRWCVAHLAAAPHPAWLREVDTALATLQNQGPSVASSPVLFTTPFAEDATTGHAFSPRVIRTIVPGRVYVASGFEFTEYYFVVSADRRQLIAIDAGTRPDAARAAYEALRSRVEGLPPLTTVFVTHAHWDHVGGAAFFRSLGTAVRFYGRDNYREEIAHDAEADPAMLARFFGTRFRLDDVLGYRPDVAIDRATEVAIGGTRFALFPARGGETGDALFIQMPAEGILFVGDAFMPYAGAPFVAEGSIDGMLDAIAQIHTLAPRILLHGHEPLTRVFASPAMLDALGPHLAWLRSEIDARMRRGETRAAIQQANLISPGVPDGTADVQLAWLVLRENLINRRFAQRSGYWRNGLEGLDALSERDIGDALVDDLGLSEAQIAAAADRLVAGGRHELAAQMTRWGLARFPHGARLEATRRLAYLKLMEKYQEFNPFKFIVYGGEIGERVPQAGGAEGASR